MDPFQADQLPSMLMEQRWADIYQRMSPEFRQQISEQELAEVGSEFVAGMTRLEEGSSYSFNGLRYRVWISDAGDKGIMGVLDADQNILGLQLAPISSVVETDQKWTVNEFQIPTEGDWFVFWGGTNVLMNYHYAYEHQRYAIDLVKMKDGYSYEGDITRNESYFAFGETVTAPAAGTVIAVVTDIPDNEPVGSMNEEQPAGNYVVIEHDGGEYSFIAHLKQHSAKVEKGERVKAGQQIGLVGNSGNSSEPHIHYHVMDGADPFDS